MILSISSIISSIISSVGSGGTTGSGGVGLITAATGVAKINNNITITNSIAITENQRFDTLILKVDAGIPAVYS